MARLTTASCRLCRREGVKLFLKGTRCTTDKCAFVKREFSPGQHGKSQRRKYSDYALQLREKQKAKRIYGLFERQFRGYFKRSEKSRGTTGEVLLQLLESRLDNVLYRANFAASRSSARQLVGHRFTKVNGRKVNISSYQVKPGDAIALAGSDPQLKAVRETTKILEGRGIPAWIEVSAQDLTIKVLRLPKKADIGMEIKENLIVELYSK